MNTAIETAKQKMIARENYFSISVKTHIRDITAIAQYILSMCCSSSNYAYNTGD